MIIFDVHRISVFDPEEDDFFDTCSVAHVLQKDGMIVEWVVDLGEGQEEGIWGVVSNGVLNGAVSPNLMKILQVLPRAPKDYLPLQEYYINQESDGPCDMEWD